MIEYEHKYSIDGLEGKYVRIHETCDGLCTFNGKLGTASNNFTSFSLNAMLEKAKEVLKLPPTVELILEDSDVVD